MSSNRNWQGYMYSRLSTCQKSSRLIDNYWVYTQCRLSLPALYYVDLNGNMELVWSLCLYAGISITLPLEIISMILLLLLQRRRGSLTPWKKDQPSHPTQSPEESPVLNLDAREADPQHLQHILQQQQLILKSRLVREASDCPWNYSFLMRFRNGVHQTTKHLLISERDSRCSPGLYDMSRATT